MRSGAKKGGELRPDIKPRSVVDRGVLGIDVGTEVPFEDPAINHISVVNLQTD